MMWVDKGLFRFALPVIFLVVSIAEASTYVYEPFNYPAYTNLAGRSGGKGLTGVWADGPDTGQAFVYDEKTAVSPVKFKGGVPLSWDGVISNFPSLPAAGARYVGMATTTGGTWEGYRPLATNAAAMAGDDRILWMSMAVHFAFSGWGEHIGLVLATDCMKDRGRQLDTTSNFGAGSGNGIGAGSSAFKLRGAVYNKGVAVSQTKDIPVDNKDMVIVVKLQFGDTNDTVSVWRFYEGTPITEAIFNANSVSTSGSVDERTLNIISFSQCNGGSALDEIRVADTFGEVIGVPPAQSVKGVLIYGK